MSSISTQPKHTQVRILNSLVIMSKMEVLNKKFY